jgi:hypothetical protein
MSYDVGSLITIRHAETTLTADKTLATLVFPVPVQLEAMSYYIVTEIEGTTFDYRVTAGESGDLESMGYMVGTEATAQTAAAYNITTNHTGYGDNSATSRKIIPAGTAILLSYDEATAITAGAMDVTALFRVVEPA